MNTGRHNPSVLIAIPVLVFFAALSIVPTRAHQQSSAQAPAPDSRSSPAIAHFHHLHLNVVDTRAAIEFYTSKFDCEKAPFAGVEPAVWAQKSWMRFTTVKHPAPWQLTSAIWHFGWGAEDMKATYQKQLDSGTKFFTPITELAPNFFYAYVESPDHNLIELNTASHHRFGHIHLFSEDPMRAGEFYIKYFGARPTGKWPPSTEPRFRPNGAQFAPSASLLIDNVNIIIYPVQYSRKAYADQWANQTAMSPSKGRVVDHIAFSFDSLPAVVEQMRKDGVRISEPIRTDPVGREKHAFIEGPDRISIELVEGHPHKD